MSSAPRPHGLVLNIQHFCTHDGPGIRTTVFLKGCTNRCKWCSNPESILAKPELAYNPAKCIGEKACGRCLKPGVFPEGAIYVVGSGPRPDDKVRINWDLATDCADRASVCPTGALYQFGEQLTAEQVLEELDEDSAFYRESNGGITISGGECLLWPDFCVELLAGAHARGINTAIETAGNVPWTSMERVLPHVDTVLHDHKLADSERHKRWVGTPNTRIRDNYKRAYQAFPDKAFIARTPVIPGVNDDEENIRAILDFIRPHPNVIDYELLPYHRYGITKYGFLGRVYEMADFRPPTAETMEHLRAIIAEAFGRTARSAPQTGAPQEALEWSSPST